jgi:hypothetical protein
VYSTGRVAEEFFPLLFRPTDAKYIDINVCFIYCALVGQSIKLYTMQGTYIKMIVNICKCGIHGCLQERFRRERWGFTVLNSLYGCIVAF